MIRIYSSKFKDVYKDPKTGKIKEIIKDQRFRESVARGDALQPYGKDKAGFFAVNKHLKETKTGEIINPTQVAQRQKEHNEEMETEAREDFEKRKKDYLRTGLHKKYH